MSIYPVRLSEWFTPGDEYGSYDTAQILVKVMRCLACDKKVRWKAAVGHHSLPWGHGDLWCSWKCCKSGKVAKADHRRERRLKRKYKYPEPFVNICPACAGVGQLHQNCILR